jgi:hypothetical protein
MVEGHAAAGFVRLFPTEDIPGILQNLRTCCEKLTRQSPFELENDLTKKLFQQLCRRAEYRTGPIEPHWESQVVVIEDDEPGITGRVDLSFSCGRGIETYFPVEAKRLFVTYPKGRKASLVADYINDGMMRFVTGQYGAKMTASAMLGYVCDSPVSKAKSALVAAMGLDAGKLRLVDGGAWRESSIMVTPPVAETRHGLGERDFTIYHLLTKV